MGRLHDAGLISDPVSKAKSVTLTDTGLRQAEAASHHFIVDDSRLPSAASSNGATESPESEGYLLKHDEPDRIPQSPSKAR